MRFPPSSLRRLWLGGGILLIVLALAAGGGALAAWGVPEEHEGEVTVSWAWAVPLALVGMALLGALVFWRGRRLLLGTVCSGALLVLLVAAWAASYRNDSGIGVGARWEGVTHVHVPDGAVFSAGGCAGTCVRWTMHPPVFDHYGVSKYNPVLLVDGSWSPAVSGPPTLGGTHLLDWPWLRQCGFDATWEDRAPAPGVSVTALYLRVPHWFLVLVLLIIPALYARAQWKLAHAPTGPRCPQCGYDLRGHVGASAGAEIGDKCPECGTAIPPAPEAAQASTRGRG